MKTDLGQHTCSLIGG